MLATVRRVRVRRNGQAGGTLPPCLGCGPSTSPATARCTLCDTKRRMQDSDRGPLWEKKKQPRVIPTTARWESTPPDWQKSERQKKQQQERERQKWQQQRDQHYEWKKWQQEQYARSRAQEEPYRPRSAVEAASGFGSKVAVAAVMVIAVGFYLMNSQKVPLTGRWRFNFLSDEIAIFSQPRAVQTIIKDVYRQGGYILPDTDPRTRIVKDIMKRLIPVSGLADLNWEIYVIADDATANAFVLPGGKVFVFSGLFNVCQNVDAVASVLGHEIAHQTASHVSERLSQVWVANLTLGSLFFLAGTLRGLALFALWTAAGGYVVPELMYHLPMSRTHEYEADHIGLMMMAEACYDPRAAVSFWQRMARADIDEVLSTHPSNDHRVAKLKLLMPEALAKRDASDCKGTASFAQGFRHALRRKQAVMPEPGTVLSLSDGVFKRSGE